MRNTRKKKIPRKNLNEVMPKDLWKFTATNFFNFKDLKNFKLVCKEAHSIVIEVIKQIEENHPEIFLREMNALMLDKFKFFENHYAYQKKVHDVVEWEDLDREEAEQNLDILYTEATALLQTKIENKRMKYSKNLGILLCILGIALILTAAIWMIIDKSFTPKQVLMLIGGLFGFFVSMTLWGKDYYSKYQNNALVENIQKPTNEIISQETKTTHTPPLITFFQKRAKVFNALSEDKKLEIIAEEKLARSIEILWTISEIYEWVCKEQQLSTPMADMMQVYCTHLNEYANQGLVKRTELPKFIRDRMNAAQTATAMQKTTEEKRVTELPMDEETVNVSKNDLSV